MLVIKKNYRPVLYLLLAVTVCAVCSFFRPARGNEDPAPQPSVEYQVLDRKVVVHDDTTIVFERIVPPTFVPPVINPQPPMDETFQQEESPLSHEVLMLSCSVRPDSSTDLRWWWNGQKFYARSSIDFHVFEGLGECTWEGRRYALILAIGHADSGDSAAPPQTAEANPPTDPARFELLPSLTTAPPEALLGVEALHAYYNLHQETLKQRHIERQAAEETRRSSLTNEKPPPSKVTMRFWPVRSARHLPHGSTPAVDGKGTGSR